MRTRPGLSPLSYLIAALIWGLFALAAQTAHSAPYAAMVIDARTGEVLHSRNADTPLHPASLTKMMTLYIAFDAIERGEIGLDTPIPISAHAAATPYAIGFRAGSSVPLRHLLRAAAIRSSNDGATAIAEALSGSEEAFARRMTETARALGMSRTTFRNAHGLTASGHMSTARDMTTLGRRVFYDFPQYYNLFSRRSADIGITTVRNTNRRLLDAYRGADGIKTGFTNAAGWNLVASAERGGERVVATVFGGQSAGWRNARVAELLDMGFERAPTHATVRRPRHVDLTGIARGGAATTLRTSGAVSRSIRPHGRPRRGTPVLTVEMQDLIEEAVGVALLEPEADASAAEEEAAAAPMPAPQQGDAPAAGETVVAQAQAPAEEEGGDALRLAAAAPDPAPEAPDAGAALAQEAPADLSAGDAPEGAPLLAVAEPQIVIEAVPLLATVPVAEAAVGLPAIADPAAAIARPEAIERVSTSGGERLAAAHLGLYPTEFEARRALLQAALADVSTLSEARRAVRHSPRGWAARFEGLTPAAAGSACARLAARGAGCEVEAP
ncbi:D-alanyl-D-alanine carboxypeptidase [Hasllibacter halocynthiae]|uniref:D-alanyl-D-alanine carboxypeptidase n=1 Tax=Hasllibacter halocynthiae TaxID=595589 RepID=A0A2T0X416_9RHOB|nr:D-alanyl-D-alanine carboxypeptidase family protein [Hasllibacter halocynthiae]PRY93688.1 D-alanyl-D-alanine carboxypeptidase [Hasllibacter halocynthiae]